MQTVTFEHALGQFGKGLDAIRSLPSLTNGTSKAATNGHSTRKLAAPQTAPEAKAVRAKPGPKPKNLAAKPAKAPKTPKKVAKAAAAKPAKAPKAKKAAAAKPVKGGAIAEGRRAVASGARPKLVDAIGIVMGSGTMSSAQIIDALNKRGWAPGASKPQAYISYTLSDNPEMFVRVKRGEYKVKSPAAFAAATKEWKSGKAERVASTNGAEKVTSKASKTSTAPAGDPPTPQADAEAAPESTPSVESTPAAAPATDTAETDMALTTLGVGTNGVQANPFAAD